ncbi:MAG: endolytic transglycosylase MltG, partial [Microbacteriaceae bacterium]|nr:endolytic transglycosylase MltG [Microbacteriaceae bacterium]
MADEPRWDDIFPAQNSSPTPVSPVGPPMTRKEALAAEGRTRPSEDGPAKDRKKKPRKSRKGWLIALISVVVILGLGAGGAAFAWANYEPQIRKLLGWELPPPDYVGKGSGEATIVIVKGDTGVEVTNSLVDAGVIKSFETFYSLLLAQDPPVDFYPGYYVLAKKMSSQAALDALRDPASRVEQTALIPEGKS